MQATPPSGAQSSSSQSSPNKSNRQVTEAADELDDEGAALRIQKFYAARPKAEADMDVDDLLDDLGDFEDDLTELMGQDGTTPTSVLPASSVRMNVSKPKTERVVSEEVMTEETLTEGVVVHEDSVPVKQGFGGSAQVESNDATAADEEGMEVTGIASMAVGEVGDEWSMSESNLEKINDASRVASQQHEKEGAAPSSAAASKAITFDGIKDLDSKLEQLFKHADADGSGSMERGEVKTMVIALGLSSDDPKLQKYEEDQAMDDADQNGDGKIDLAEFKEHMNDFLEGMGTSEFEQFFCAAMNTCNNN